MRNSTRRLHLFGVLFVLALTLLFALVNRHWLQANVVTYGWDRLDHLITSFVYRDLLQQLTPNSLLAALAYSDYYPPLVHYGAVLLYALLGVDEDVAPLVNVLYLLILLGATFWLAAHWRGQRDAHEGVRTGQLPGAAHEGVRTGQSVADDWSPFWAGALAAALLGLFPMIFAMSRYLYLDFALTALTALSLALLLASARFDRRWPALGFGLALGLAFLVKWTAAAFVIGPLAYIVLRSGVLPYAWRRPRALLPNWRRLLLALAVGPALIGGWFALAPDAAAGLRLGPLLALPLGLLLGGVFYALLAPQPSLAADTGGGCGRVRLRNLLGAGVIAAFVIALWYLTNVEFLDYFLFTAYGREEQPFYAFGKYLREVLNEQLGPWFALVFVVVTLAWAWQAWRRWQAARPRKHGLAAPQVTPGVPAGPARGVAGGPHKYVRAARDVAARDVAARDVAWVLLLWVVVPYVVFSFRVTLAHSRFLMPFLPPFAVWMAVGLLQWRPRLLRAAAVALVLLVGAAQYALLSFDELGAWRAPLRLEVGGQPVNLLASGFFIQYPTSGVTDPGYAVAPAVLAYVDGQRLPGGAPEGREVVNLGLLVNSYQVHEKHFLYAIYKDFPHVRLRELARNWREQSAYNQLFDMDYVLVGDTHTFRTNANSQEVVQRILYDEDDAFHAAFAPVRQWTLPSGEQLTLYGRRFLALEPGLSAGDSQALLTWFGDRLGPGDALVLVSPDQVYMLGLALPEDAGATLAPLPAAGEAADQAAARLQELAATHNRIFLLSHNAEQVDPNGSIEAWLRANTAAGLDQWAGSVRITPFAPLAAGADTEDTDAGDGGARGGATTPLQAASWRGGPTLAFAAVQGSGQAAELAAGGALVATLRWDEDGAAEGTAPRKASLQLLGPDGALVAQEDREIAVGEQPYVLLIPRSAPPGDYRLLLVVYDPATGERLASAAGGDAAELGTVAIGPAPAPAPAAFPPLRHPEDAEDEGS